MDIRRPGEPLVSVIVTSYNQPRLICGALRSIQAQTEKNWEALVVDDNSDEMTWKMIQGFAKNDPRIVPMRTDLARDDERVDLNRYAHCINLGLAQSKAQYVTYLCDDDLYKPRRLEMMTNYLTAYPEVFVVYGEQELQELDEQGNIIGTGFRSGPKICTDAAQKVDTSSVMHRRSCFEIKGGWPEGKETWRCGDAHYWKILNQQWPFHRISQTTDVHRFNPRSVSYKMDHDLAFRHG